MCADSLPRRNHQDTKTRRHHETIAIAIDDRARGRDRTRKAPLTGTCRVRICAGEISRQRVAPRTNGDRALHGEDAVRISSHSERGRRSRGQRGRRPSNQPPNDHADRATLGRRRRPRRPSMRDGFRDRNRFRDRIRDRGSIRGSGSSRNPPPLTPTTQRPLGGHTHATINRDPDSMDGFLSSNSPAAGELG